MIIAIDGPSGTGKTTVARKVAQRLNFAYFDTGATYRAITWFFLQRKTPLEEEKQIKKALEGFEFSFKAVGQERRYFVGPEDVTTAIRTPLVTRFVSQVSALRPVREVVWKRQRDAAKGQDAVFEGRDMGTVVFPDADLKIFLTARPEVRAQRRLKELEGDKSVSEEQHRHMLEELMQRDRLDSTRKLAPLKQARDAHLIDTSDCTVDEVVEMILNMVAGNVKKK
ncbi:MAG: cytidylate kinase [Chlamydiae bacterium RIFCSPHIGHO2_12_FULL_49_32]|nr:MAG: cytidylate kinase [Chlamydiae bacterium RIFCSPHIGHO2_12_FULL_49_32]